MMSNKLDKIRQLYFQTSKNSVEKDLSKAVQIFKTLPDEVSRGSAAVYMDGLSQMRSEWRLEKTSSRRTTKYALGRKKR